MDAALPGGLVKTFFSPSSEILFSVEWSFRCKSHETALPKARASIVRRKVFRFLLLLRDVTGLWKFLSLWIFFSQFNIAIRTFRASRGFREWELKFSPRNRNWNFAHFYGKRSGAGAVGGPLAGRRQAIRWDFSHSISTNIFSSIISELVCMLKSGARCVCTFNSFANALVRPHTTREEDFHVPSLSFGCRDGESVPMDTKRQTSQSRNTRQAIFLSR